MDFTLSAVSHYGMMILFIAVSLAGSILSIVLHEIAHGFAALLFGDSTAREQGRLSLNPVRHIDPVGTVVLPLVCYILNALHIANVFFGWAKPVPIDPGRMRNRKAGMIVVSLAGVTVNFILGALFLGLFRLTAFEPFASIMVFNAMLFAFNVIPFPPLDGYNLVMSILPEKWTSRFRVDPRIFIGIFIALMLTGVLRYIYTPIFRFVISIYEALFRFRIFL